MRRKRPILNTISIFGEGPTELLYFENMKDFLGGNLFFDVEPLGCNKCTAYELVSYAKGKMENDDLRDGDEYWVVFDKNGYTKHPEAFELAQSGDHIVNIAFSSIAFEMWVLLHFEQSVVPYEKSEEIIKYLNRNHFAYSKTDADLYKHLKSKIADALDNTAWLRYKQKSELESNNYIYKLNPYCTIDSLIYKLFNDQKERQYYGRKEVAEIDGISFKITDRRKRSNKISISISINNLSSISHIINSEAYRFRIKLLDNSFIAYDDFPNKLLQPNGESNLIFNFEYISKYEAKAFVFDIINKTILFELYN